METSSLSGRARGHEAADLSKDPLPSVTIEGDEGLGICLTTDWKVS